MTYHCISFDFRIDIVIDLYIGAIQSYSQLIVTAWLLMSTIICVYTSQREIGFGYQVRLWEEKKLFLISRKVMSLR